MSIDGVVACNPVMTSVARPVDRIVAGRANYNRHLSYLCF